MLKKTFKAIEHCIVPETNGDQSKSNRGSANPGNLVLARPRTFIRRTLLLSSNVKSLVAVFKIQIGSKCSTNV